MSLKADLSRDKRRTYLAVPYLRRFVRSVQSGTGIDGAHLSAPSLFVMAHRFMQAALQHLAAGVTCGHAFAGLHDLSDNDLQVRAGDATGDLAFIAAIDPGVGNHMGGGEFMFVR